MSEQTTPIRTSRGFNPKQIKFYNYLNQNQLSQSGSPYQEQSSISGNNSKIIGQTIENISDQISALQSQVKQLTKENIQLKQMLNEQQVTIEQTFQCFILAMNNFHQISKPSKFKIKELNLQLQLQDAQFCQDEFFQLLESILKFYKQRNDEGNSLINYQSISGDQKNSILNLDPNFSENQMKLNTSNFYLINESNKENFYSNSKFPTTKSKLYLTNVTNRMAPQNSSFEVNDFSQEKKMTNQVIYENESGINQQKASLSSQLNYLDEKYKLLIKDKIEVEKQLIQLSEIIINFFGEEIIENKDKQFSSDQQQQLIKLLKLNSEPSNQSYLDSIQIKQNEIAQQDDQSEPSNDSPRKCTLTYTNETHIQYSTLGTQKSQRSNLDYQNIKLLLFSTYQLYGQILHKFLVICPQYQSNKFKIQQEKFKQMKENFEEFVKFLKLVFENYCSGKEIKIQEQLNKIATLIYQNKNQILDLTNEISDYLESAILDQTTIFGQINEINV